MNAFSRTIFAILFFMLSGANAQAIDPPYQGQMQQLLGVVGSLYFLQPLCGEEETDWRQQAADLIALDEPDDDRRQRLNGAFNQGYQDYSRLHQSCSVSARQAITRLLIEGGDLSRDIHSRYAE